MKKEELKQLLYHLISKNLHTKYMTKDFVNIEVNYEGEQPSFWTESQDKYKITLSYPSYPITNWYIYFNTHKELNEVLDRIIEHVYNDYEEIVRNK